MIDEEPKMQREPFSTRSGVAGQDMRTNTILRDQPAAPSFLMYTSGSVSGIRRRLEDVQSLLSSAGFYGPPSEAKNMVQPAAEDNTRSGIVEEIDRIERLLPIIEYQLNQLVG